MATAEQVLGVLSSHASGDESRFASVAMQIAAGEAQKGRAIGFFTSVKVQHGTGESVGADS